MKWCLTKSIQTFECYFLTTFLNVLSRKFIPIKENITNIVGTNTKHEDLNLKKAVSLKINILNKYLALTTPVPITFNC